MKIFGGLVFAAILSGVFSGLFFFGAIGVFLVLPAAILVALLFGFPMYLLLCKFGWLAWWQVVFAGMACVLPVAILMAYDFKEPLFVALVLVSGALGGGLFWWAAAAHNKSLNPDAGQAGAG